MQIRDNAEGNVPSKIFLNGQDVFTDYFNRKSVLTLATRLTEDMMKAKGYSAHEVGFARDAVYLAIILLQGSMHTSGSVYCVTNLLKCLGYQEDHAYWAGFAAGTAVSLAMDLTPWGVLSTAISVIGSVLGKKSALWAYNHIHETRVLSFAPQKVVAKACAK
jgi:hypothetical protein